MAGIQRAGRRLRASIVGAITISMLATPLVVVGGAAPAGAATPVTTAVAVSEGGGSVGDVTLAPSVSADGNRVAYVTDLGSPTDVNGQLDIYLRDIAAATTTRVSVPAPGGVDNSGVDNSEARFPAISADGQHVAFASSSQLTPDKSGTNFEDIFVRDLDTGTTTRVGAALGGTDPNNHSHMPSISEDGRYVAFYSDASNLVAGDVNGVADGFRVDRDSDADGIFDEPGTVVVTRVGFGNEGIPGEVFATVDSWMSADGGTVVVDAVSTPSGFYTGRVVDFHNGTTPVDHVWPGAGAGPNSFGPVSADGRFMVGGNSISTLAVFDMYSGLQMDTSFTSNPGAFPADYAISADGLTIGVANGASGSGHEVFAVDVPTDTTTLVSVDNSGVDPLAQAGTRFPALSASGRYVVMLTSEALDGSTPGPNSPHIVRRDRASSPVHADVHVKSIDAAANASVRTDLVPPKVLFNKGGATVGTALGDIDLQSTSATASPLRNIPLRNIGLAGIPLRNINLGTVTTSYPGGWEALLVGTPFETRKPLQSIGFEEVLAYMEANPGSTIAALTLDDVDLSHTPLRNISLAAAALGDATLGDIPLHGETTPAASFQGWCTELAAAGFSCTALAITQNSTVAAVELAGVPLRNIPLRNIPLRNIDITESPLRNIPLGNIKLDRSPLRNIPLRNIGTASAPLRNIPLRNIPLRNIDVDPSPLRNIPLRNIAESASPLRNIPLRNIPLRNIDVDPSPLRNIPLRNIAQSASPLRNIPLRNIPLRNIDVDQSPLRNIPLRNIAQSASPLRNIPLRNIPLRNIDTASSPLRNIPLRNIANNGAVVDCARVNCTTAGTDTLRTAAELSPTAIQPNASLGDILANLDPYILGDVSYYIQANGTDVTLVDILDGLGTYTLEDLHAYITGSGADFTLADLAAVLDGFSLGDLHEFLSYTLGDILTLVDGFVLGDLKAYEDVTLGEIQAGLPDTLTLSDVLLGLLEPQDFPWEDAQLGADFAQQYASPPLNVPVIARGSFDDGAGTTMQDTLYNVAYPLGYVYAANSAVVAVSGRPVVAQEPSIITATQVIWDLGDLPSGTTVTITFTVLPNDLSNVTVNDQTLLNFQGFLHSTAGTAYSANVFGFDYDGNAPSIILRSDGNLTPATATAVTPETLYFGRIAAAGEKHYYSIPVPPRGTRVQVTVSGLGADADLALFQTTAASISAQPDRTIGLQSVPVGDDVENVDGTTVEHSQAEGLQDANLQPPAGSSFVATSMNRNDDDESLTLTSGLIDNTSPYLMQVAGYQGAGVGHQFMLRVHYVTPPPPPPCSATQFQFPEGAEGTLPTSLPANVNTLILVNQERMAHLYGTSGLHDANEAMAAAQQLAANAADGVIGAVVPVDGDLAVGNAYAAWDSNPCNPDAANNVVEAITSVIKNLVNANPGARASLKSIAILGADDVIPQARVTDATSKANESGYLMDLLRADGKETPQSAAARAQTVLTDNPYGTFSPIPWLERKLYVPDVAVGRVVETPAEIETAIQQFDAANGVLNPTTALTAGYDFLNDGSHAVDDGLGARIAPANRTVLTDDGSNPHWSKNDLLNALFPGGALQPPSIAALNAHFDQAALLPALGGFKGAVDHTLLSTNDIAAQGPNSLLGRILFSMGCHGGLSVPDTYVSDVTNDRALDWDQVMRQAGAAVWVANSGFGYGDTASVALTERLMAMFARRLDGRMTIGQALSFAKQEYLGGLGLYGAFDEKVIEESGMYGLPMYRISPAATGPSNLPPLPPPSGDPLGNGVTSSSISSHPTLSTAPGPDGTTYQTADGRSPQITHDRPITPRVEYDATRPAGQPQAHGALITSLTSTDSGNVRATFANPIMDLAADEPPVHGDDVAFPAKQQNVTTYTDFDGQHQHLVLMPSQFFGDEDPDTPTGTGTRRTFTDMGAKVYYSASTDFVQPTLDLISGSIAGTTVTFSAKVSDSAGIAKVLVLALGAGGVWSPVDLTGPAAGGTWNGTMSVPSGTTGVTFIVEAVDKNGNVAVDSRKGDNHRATGHTPDVAAGGNATIAQGTTFTRSGSFTDADSTSWTATVDYGDSGGAQALTLSGHDFQLSHTYAAAGTYTVTVNICDEASCGSSTFQVVVQAPNQAPVVNAGMAATVDRGVEFTRNGSFTDDASTSWTATVDYGDGSGVQSLALTGTSFTLSHTYTTVGNKTVTVVVCDNANACGTGSFVMTVTEPNVAPIVNAGGNGSATTDAPFTRSGSFTDDDSTSWTGTVDYGDGITQGVAITGTTFSLSHQYGTVGLKNVVVTVCDEHNACSTGTFTVTVTLPNQAPVVNAGGNATIVVGDSLSRTGSFTDADSTSWTATVNYGDGGGTNPLAVNQSARTFALSHQYTTLGTFTGTVTVCDEHNVCASDTFVVTVRAPNQAPVVSAGGNASVNTGATFTRNGSFTDSDSTSWTGTVDWNDGGGPQTLTINQSAKTFTLSHVFSMAGPHVVQVSICDEQVLCGTTTFTITAVTPNGTPVVTAGGNANVTMGVNFTRNGSFTDTGSTSWTASVDWDEGSGFQPVTVNQTAKTFSLAHTFITLGPKVVVVKVCDNQGACGDATFTVTVIAPNQPPVVNAGTDVTISAADTLTRPGSFTDNDSTSWTASVNYGDGTGTNPLTLNQTAKMFTLSHQYNSLGVKTVTVTICDGQACGSTTFDVSVVDGTPPVVVGTASRAPNGAGWYNANVTITWTSTDPAPSSGAPNVPPPTVVSSQGENQDITSAPSCDPAGNCTVGHYSVSLDKVNPTGNISSTGLILNLLGVLNGRETGTVGDELSGPASVKVTYTSALLGLGNTTVFAVLSCEPTGHSCTWSAPVPTLPGLYTVSAVLTDRAGNLAYPPTTTLKIIL